MMVEFFIAPVQVSTGDTVICFSERDRQRKRYRQFGGGGVHDGTTFNVIMMPARVRRFLQMIVECLLQMMVEFYCAGAGFHRRYRYLFQ
jgi:hypothetical protein